MAHSNVKVLLGFPDEFVSEKHSSLVNYTTNKFGGKADWTTTVPLSSPPCPLCQFPRPLIVQIYAPLDNSQYHRTLYLFACINPNCWNQNESWICLRGQVLEQQNTDVTVSNNTPAANVTDWCQDADDWDDNNANNNEENGNLINPAPEHLSEDEESCSFEEVVRSGLGNLTVDDRNANKEAKLADLQGGGAVGRQNSPIASAEIEGDENEIVSIDAPTAPQYDIPALLQEVTPLPQELYHRASQKDGNHALQFMPYFISVGEEVNTASNLIPDHHIRDLLQEYQQNNEEGENLLHVEPLPVNASDAATLEKYEKSLPAHGDKIFHHFLTKIHNNPGQILRYNRGAAPLLISPLQDVPRKCKNCQGELIFEMQVLSTLIPNLRLQADENNGSRIEFGTVLIFTCLRSCWSSDANFREEEIVVQAEKY